MQRAVKVGAEPGQLCIFLQVLLSLEQSGSLRMLERGLHLRKLLGCFLPRHAGRKVHTLRLRHRRLGDDDARREDQSQCGNSGWNFKDSHG